MNELDDVDHLTGLDRQFLAEFLLARIDEDEDIAKHAAEAPDFMAVNARWHQAMTVDRRIVQVERSWGGCVPIVKVEQSYAHANHIAHFDPVRVLDECEAKRTLVARGSSSVLCALSLAYRHHYEWQDEWHPGFDHDLDQKANNGSVTPPLTVRSAVNRETRRGPGMAGIAERERASGRVSSRSPTQKTPRHLTITRKTALG